MKHLFIVSLFILTLSSCSDVTDSNKDKIQLTSKYELVYYNIIDSVWTLVSSDTMSVGMPLLGRITYANSFRLKDVIKYKFYFGNGLKADHKTIITSEYADSTTAISAPLRLIGNGTYYSIAEIFRNDSLIWTGKDTIFVKLQ